jgi:DNA-binding response OmpR family regulator
MSEKKNKKKILVIEDDDYVSELLKYLFSQKNNFEIAVAGDGSKALEMIEEEVPDLIFLDFMLPKIDGVEVCRRLRKNDRTSKVPVVLMSASLKLHDMVKEEIGVNYILSKPFNMTEILNIVESLKLRG